MVLFPTHAPNDSNENLVRSFRFLEIIPAKVGVFKLLSAGNASQQNFLAGKHETTVYPAKPFFIMMTQIFHGTLTVGSEKNSQYCKPEDL